MYDCWPHLSYPMVLWLGGPGVQIPVTGAGYRSMGARTLDVPGFAQEAEIDSPPMGCKAPSMGCKPAPWAFNRTFLLIVHMGEMAYSGTKGL